MKNKNKMMSVLLIISALTAGLIPAIAAPNRYALEKTTVNTQVKPIPMTDLQSRPAPNTLTQVKPVYGLDISDLDESSIDDRILESLEADPNEEDIASVLWYLNAYGYTVNDDPVTDAAETRFRVKLQLVAEKIKMTEFGALYEVHWGRVTHDGEKHEVDGYALLDGDGVFYMKLDGDVAFKAIGRIHSSWFGVRLSMKGYLVDDGVSYSHRMRGWAIPLTPSLLIRISNHQQ